MLAVGLGAAEALPYVEKYNGKIVVACHNSLNSITLSGDLEAIDQLKETFSAEKIFVRTLKTGGKAYYSPHMADAAFEYEKYLKSGLRPTEAVKLTQDCEMISSVTGSPMSGSVPDDSYWAQNLASLVLFNQAVQNMIVLNPLVNLVVEVGPHSALAGPVNQIFKENKLHKISYLLTLVRNEHEGDRMLSLAGNLWSRGAAVHMSTVTKVESLSEDGTIEETQGPLLVDLPPYQWTYKKKLLLESRESQEHRRQKHERHDTAGRKSSTGALITL